MPEAVATRQPAPAKVDARRTVASPAGRTVYSPPGVAGLQRALGNQGMQRLLRSKVIQPKLTIGPADDQYEREADQVADEVMRMPDPGAGGAPSAVQRKCPDCESEALQRAPVAIQRMCPECEKEELQRAPITVQRLCPHCEDQAAHRSPAPIQRACPECEKEKEERAASVQRKCTECEQEAEQEDEEQVGLVQRQCVACEDLKVQPARRPGLFPGAGVGQRALVTARVQPAAIARKCAKCAEEESAGVQRTVASDRGGSDLARVQAKHLDGAAPEPSAEVADYIHSSSGGGRPLPASVRERFESRFGHDFSGVRVHTDSRSAAAAAEINSYAFATGSDIHFAAGQFQPGTPHGDRLLAHELTHTIQQTGGAGRAARDAPSEDGAPGRRATQVPRISRSRDGPVQRMPSGSEVMAAVNQTVRSGGTEDTATKVAAQVVTDLDEGLADAGAAAAADAGVGDAATGGGPGGRGGGQPASAAVAGFGGTLGPGPVGMFGPGPGPQPPTSFLGDKNQGLGGALRDWLSTPAGKTAQDLADSFGGTLRPAGLNVEIVVPTVCPIKVYTRVFDLPSFDRQFLVPVVALPLGPVFLSGAVGVAGHLQPLAEIRLGPVCLTDVKITIDTSTDTYRIQGSVTGAAAAALGAEVRGGVRGEVSLDGIVLIGGVPTPISVPALGLEGGLAGLIRGTGAATLSIGGSLGVSRGAVSLGLSKQLAVQLGADLYLGAYAQLDLLGKTVCRIYWQPFEWHGNIGGSMGLSLGLSVVPGSAPALTPTVDTPSFPTLPLDQTVPMLSREGFYDDCAIIDRVCESLREQGQLPSQNGGVWNCAGPYGPGSRLPGPLAVYVTNPGIPSGAQCRGACGPDCETCEPTPRYQYVDPATGDTWEYANYDVCGTHDGCRQHDAAFDWAAAVHGETGPDAIYMKWHMRANIECACNYPAGNCIGWIKGLPPFDGHLCFADSATQVSHGGGGGAAAAGSCREQFPGAAECVASYPDKDIILAVWGLIRGVKINGPAAVAADYTNASMIDCQGPGRIWNAEATDFGSGQGILVAIAECICCNDDDSTGSAWLHPHVLVVPGMPVELILDLCDRDLILRETCVPFEEASSTAVPSLNNRTWFLADRAIRNQDFPGALGIVLDRLVARGFINESLANWSYTEGDGDAVTNFQLIEDEKTHERRARPPVSVQVHPAGFADVGWLFSSMMHEYVHVLQVLAGAPAGEFTAKGEQRPEFVARDEVESYLWEIEHALGTGIINDAAQLRELGERLTTHFNLMTKELKAQYQARYDAAQQRVITTIATGGPTMSIEDARRIVREAGQEIAALLAKRPGNEAAIDAQIEAIRKRRERALIEVALADNPTIQVVRPGEPGVYRVPTVDAEGRVRYLYGGIQVAWHLAQASTSVYTLGETLSAGGKMAAAGTAVQGRVQPFPPDVDFDEQVSVVANTLRAAAAMASTRIVGSIRRISGGPKPGSDEIEFRQLLSFPASGPRVTMSLNDINKPTAERVLARGIEALASGGNINTFWRGFLADGRFISLTKVIFVSAKRPDGTDLIKLGGAAEFQLAFLEDPGEITQTKLGRFAWDMCCSAVKNARQKDWLKAAKRAYNYFSTIGDTVHMALLEPAFRRPEANVEQYATVIDGISFALGTRDPLKSRKGRGIPQAQTRILTVTEARDQVESVAKIVESVLPDTGIAPGPAEIASLLRRAASRLQARPESVRQHLAQDDVLAETFDSLAEAVRKHIAKGIRPEVEDVINQFVLPVCPDEEKCKRQR